ncbi:MAG: hypothetical protein NZ521_06510, partial [Flammeovirgaceae bacterium]|nr:hypothetical protein [Flammeovirgaceae bacterium]MDW8287510.1 hypothetical protein [Flammeovirgaceae bacterium]
MKGLVVFVLLVLLGGRLSGQNLLKSEGDFPKNKIFRIMAYPLDGKSGSLVVQNGKLSNAVTDKKGIV